MSHAVQWLNTARRVLAHVRAYLDIGQYGERRDSEQACLRTCRHGSSCSPLWGPIYYYCPLKLLFLHLSRTSDSFFCPTKSIFFHFCRMNAPFRPFLFSPQRILWFSCLSWGLILFSPQLTLHFWFLVGKFHFLNYTPHTIELHSIAIPRSKELDNSQFIM